MVCLIAIADEYSAMTTLKVMTVLGTRPEIIRLSRVMAHLEESCNHVLVHTGQNYDFELNEVFFDDLGVKKPDYFLGVDTSSLGRTIGEILSESERVIEIERPDAILILGDTNSAISAYIARRMKVPVYHMEAGNRCFDRNVPEETNRKLVDHLADFNLVYTEHARRNLLQEGLPSRRIIVTGSPMREVLDYYKPQFQKSDILERLDLVANGFILASLHREENVDDAARLSKLVQALAKLGEANNCKVVVSTHPRTKHRLDALSNDSANERIHWLKPFGFHDYNRLQCESLCVLSDSGTIAEESSILGFSAVTPRFSIERPEAVDTGAILACGIEPEDISRCVNLVIKQGGLNAHGDIDSFIPADYRIKNTSQRVVNLILSTAQLSNQWDGIRSPSVSD